MAILLVIFSVLIGSCTAENYQITPINSSSGLYYEKIGQILLSNNNWEFVTSIDYKGYLLFYQYLELQSAKLKQFCNIVNQNYCEERWANVRTQMSRIEERDEIMAGFLGIKIKPKRISRFAFAELGSFFQGLGNGIASVLGVFMGGSRQPDMSAYEAQISALRNGQEEIVNRINMQTTAFVADAEKKNVQIKLLQDTQSVIQNKLVSLQTDLTKETEERTKQINDLNAMLNNTRKQLEQQEKVQKKLVNDVEVIEGKLLGINKTLENLLNVVSEQGKSLNETKIKVELNSLTIDFNMVFDQFENEQKMLFEVIKKAKRGELDPYVLTPLNLMHMMLNIYPNLPENVKFPFFPTIENAHFLYNLITPEVNFYNYTLYFILNMPLVYSKTFDIHKITSLPTPVARNVFAFVRPTEPFLLIDKEGKEYQMMSYKEYTNFCKEIDKNVFICKQSQPLHSVYANNKCEVSLFHNSKTIPDTCEKRIIFLNDILFLQLMKDKSWIYIAPELETNILINCDSSTVPLSIEGSGFVSITSKCKMKYKEFVIESLKEFTRPVVSNYTSKAKLNDVITPSDVKNVQRPVAGKYKTLVLPFDLNELDSMSVLIESRDSSLSYLYFLIILPFLAFIICISVFIYKRNVNIRLLVTTWSRRLYATDNHQVFANVSSSNEDHQNGKLPLQVKNNNSKISALTLHGAPSENDPDSEYLTVRVKLKKNVDKVNKEPKITNLHTDNTLRKEDAHMPNAPTSDDLSEDDVYGNNDVIIQEKFLKNLRKMKPKP